MRLSDFCNRRTLRAPLPAARFPTAPTFVPRSLSTPQPSSLVLIHRRPPLRACAIAGVAMNHRVDVRLTANLQLRPCHNPPGGSFSDPDEPAPRFDHLVRAPRIPGGASIESPAAPCFPSAALSATGEHVAPPLTPLVATAPFEPDLSIRPALAAARIRLHPCLVKGNGFVAPRTPSLDECLSSLVGPDASRRLLQSEQPTSTTTNLPIPGPNAPTWLAQLALNRRGGGPIRRIDIRSG